MTESELGKTFAALADCLMPEAEGMPMASEVADLNVGLETILNIRPDLRGDVMRGLRILAGKTIDDATLNSFAQANPECWSALGLAVLGIYYGSEKVQSLISYTGPKRETYDADAIPDYVTESLLEPVIRRGPIWRKV